MFDDRIDELMNEAINADDPEYAFGMITFARMYCGVFYDEQGGNSHIEYMLEVYNFNREKAKDLFSDHTKALTCVDKGIKALEIIKNCNNRLVTDETYARYLSEAGDCCRHAAVCLNSSVSNFLYKAAYEYYVKSKALCNEGDVLFESNTILINKMHAAIS